MSLLIKNGTLVTMNSKREVIKADILVENNYITAIAPEINIIADQIIDARNKLVIPGLIQAHTHLCQTLFRGLADDMELLNWLKLRIWPLEGSHDEESLYYSTVLGAAECLLGGTTAVIDMGTVHHTGSIFNAVKDIGIRYLGGKCMMDYGHEVPESLLDSTDNAIQESLDLWNWWNGRENGRISYAFCPRFVLSCTRELLTEMQKLSKQYNIPVHTHASENKSEIALIQKEKGMSNLIYFNKLGICNERLIVAHCIHLDEEEMQLLKDTGSNVVHCPSSNLKLASGIARIPELIEQGVNVSIGADGAPCNNNMDIFQEMRLAALIHKPGYGPRAMPAEQVFELSTLGGARAMGMENQLGSLEIGKRADIVLVNLADWHTQPALAASVYSHLVYQSKSSDVSTVIVDGKILVSDRKIRGINEEELKRQIEKSLKRVAARSGLEINHRIR